MKITSDPVAGYRIADLDDAAAVKYYGYTGAGGAWYILQEDAGAKTYRYASGASGYAAAWIGRAALTYGYFHESV